MSINETSGISREWIQESEYDISYHFIVSHSAGVWKISRDLPWGYEYLAVLETIKSLVMSNNPRSVLDFGCGDGRIIYELCLENIDKIVGIDNSERALSFSRANTGHDPRVSLHETLKDITNERFDVVIAMEVLEHIHPKDFQSILMGIHRCIEARGVFIVSVPTCNVPLNRKHYRHFKRDDIEELFNKFFTMEEIYFIHKIGIFSNMVRRMTINRLVSVNVNLWLALSTFLYKRYVLRASENNGAHLIAVLRKI